MCDSRLVEGFYGGGDLLDRCLPSKTLDANCSGYCSGCWFRWGWMGKGRASLPPTLAECYQLDTTWSNPALQAEIRIKSQLLCQLSYAPFVRLFPGTSADASAEHRQSRLMSQLGKLRVRKAHTFPLSDGLQE